MKLKKLIRYIEGSAPAGSQLYFYDAGDESYSTGEGAFVCGDVTESGGLARPNQVELSLRASDGGVALRKEDFVGWLNSLVDSHGNKKVLLRLHGNRGRSRAHHTMLTDDMWSHIQHQGDGRYSLSEPTKARNDAVGIDWGEVAHYGGFS